MGKYRKVIVAVLGAVLTSLATYYGHAEWYTIVTTLATALGVYRVPNLPKAAAPVKE